jgi:cysteinyl-tRNA synthetase
VERLVAERVTARERRDFARSDAIRAEIAGLGWVVEDTPAGPRLTRKEG